MPRNGSGTYTLPAPAPFQTGTTISATGMNTVQTDQASALTASTAADGQTPITGNWNFKGYNIAGLGTVTAANISTTASIVAGDALSVTKGGALIAGGAAVVGGATVSGGFVVATGGAAVTGNSTVTGTLTISSSVTMASAEIGAAGPTWTVGTGAPGTTTPRGSLFSRTDGGVGTTLYVSQGGGTWNPVAGV